MAVTQAGSCSSDYTPSLETSAGAALKRQNKQKTTRLTLTLGRSQEANPGTVVLQGFRRQRHPPPVPECSLSWGPDYRSSCRRHSTGTAEAKGARCPGTRVLRALCLSVPCILPRFLQKGGAPGWLWCSRHFALQTQTLKSRSAPLGAASHAANTGPPPKALRHPLRSS